MKGTQRRRWGGLLGLGPSTVRTRLARAREKLKAQLREE